MPNNHEERICHLEEEISALRSKLDSLATSHPWWERIAGSFEQDPTYEKAMKLGRQYRESLRPKPKRAKRK